MPPKKDIQKQRRAHGLTCITQNVSGTNVQIGHGNVIEDRRNQTNDKADKTEGACASLPASSDPKKTYAQAVSGKVNQHIQADSVTIHTYINASTTENKAASGNVAERKREQVALFLESVEGFKRGHFVLVVGKLDTLEFIDSVSLIPWKAVFDFDPESRSTGLLSSVESTLNKHQSLHIGSIQDSYTFSDQITNWIFLMGCADRSDTLTAVEAGDWKKEVDKEIDKKLLHLKEFEAGVTHFKFVVLWPSDSNTAKCMNFILSKVCTRMSSSVVIVDNGEVKSRESSLTLDVLRLEKEVTVVKLGVKEIGHAIIKVSNPVLMESSSYCLPTKDESNDPGINEEVAQWLKEDLEILYLKNTTGIEYNAQQLQDEVDIFHKGGTLPWAWWYEAGSGHADIERDVMKPLVKSIKKNYVENGKSGIITLLHSPGSGGTTLSQRVMWELKDSVPCAQMKQSSGSTVADLVDKITSIYDRTNMPVVILLDGEDEHRIESLWNMLDQSDICTIMLHVRRYSYEEELNEGRPDIFVLHDKLSKREARNLIIRCNAKNDKRRKNVEQLAEDVQNGKDRTIFEFGLAAHSYEYRGIQAYVRGHLKISEDDEDQLLPWQTALAYLSLVYFYGHASIPCHFFTNILRLKDNKKILETNDFPHEMQEFVVRGVSRMYTARISHFYVAKEILDQVLARSCRVERSMSPYLCNAAKKLLGSFCQGFIERIGQTNDGNSSEFITKMLINTFIKREHRDILEDETQDKRLKGPNKPQFSHILEDASSNAPFSERFDILQQLVKSFPSEAQFRAHLGRLYTICRPEKEQDAEENLKIAYEMSSAILHEKKMMDEIPYSRRLDIRNICHMYGSMLSRKVFKYTGKCSTDEPAIVVGNDQFSEKAKSILNDVKRACKLFSETREVMSQRSKDCLGFEGDIKVRLMFCRLVKEKGGSPDLESFVRDNNGDIVQFVNDCFANLDNLFDEMHNVCDAKNIEAIGQPLQEMYMDIMSADAPGHYVYEKNENTPKARRTEIGKLKAQYGIKPSQRSIEKLKQEHEVRFVVDCFEKNFQTDDPSDKDLDKDYREWIRAIRHPLFPERYTIERVYTHVQRWYENVQKQSDPRGKIAAKFYCFVLSSILGFGTFGQPGNVELLSRSQILKKELMDLARYSRNSDYLFEWLGPPVPTIDRLIYGKRYFRISEGVLPKEEQDLEVWLGTVCPPNTRPNSGIIALDLGPGNRESVHIHYAPFKWNMKGKGFVSCRVEFVICFNVYHGYEAFMVQRVGRLKCLNFECGNTVERRSCDKAVKCPKCS